MVSKKKETFLECLENLLNNSVKPSLAHVARGDTKPYFQEKEGSL